MRYTRHVSNLALKSRKFKEASPEEKQLKKIKTKRKYIYMHKKTPFYLHLFTFSLPLDTRTDTGHV